MYVLIVFSLQARKSSEGTSIAECQDRRELGTYSKPS